MKQNAQQSFAISGVTPSELVVAYNSFTMCLFGQNCIPAQGCLGTAAQHMT
jgi:hypothetical protein